MHLRTMNGVRRIICTMASRCCFFSHIQKKGRPALSSALNKHNDQHIATNTQKPRLYVCSTRLAHFGFSGFPRVPFKIGDVHLCAANHLIRCEQLLSHFNLLAFCWKNRGLPRLCGLNHGGHDDHADRHITRRCQSSTS